MSAADAAAAASQATAAGGLVGSGSGAYQGIAGAVDAAGGYNALNPSATSLINSGTAGGDISVPATAGAGASSPTGAALDATTPASTTAGAVPAGAGAPDLAAGEALSSGAPPPENYWSQTASNSTGTLSDVAPVESGTMQTTATGPSMAETNPVNFGKGYLDAGGALPSGQSGLGWQLGQGGAGLTQTAAGGQGLTGGLAGATGAETPSWLSKGLDALTKFGSNPMNDLSAASLAYNAYGQYKNNKAMGDMQQQLKNAVAPLNATQQQLLSQYNSGTLSASDTQSINDYVTQQTAQIKQQYASMGQGGSPQEAQAIAAVQAQVGPMQDQALKNYLSEALSTTGAITGPYSTIVQQQISQDTALQNAGSNVFKAIAAQQSGQPAKQ
jgi:hypothetical protein